MRSLGSAVVFKTMVDHLRSTKKAASVGAARIARTAAPTSTLTFQLGEHGRLGNQLFQIAGTIGIAGTKDADAVFRRSWKYRAYFSLPDRFFAGWLTIARSGQAWPYATGIDERARVYLQDLSLWHTCRESIHRWFQPSGRAQEVAAERYFQLLALPSKTCIHVRRGDFVTNRLHQPCPISYYEQAVERIQTEDSSTQFLVFSDDIGWCRQNLSLPGAHYMVGNPDWLDLTLMSRCEHHICANSTFSWWGAFLSTNPSPIVPWLTGVTWPLRMSHPEGWHEIEITPDS